MVKFKKNSLKYWLNEVDEGLDDLEHTYIRIGKALWAIHGLKGRKKNQLWKQDPDSKGCRRFADYCFVKWPTIGRTTIYQYMQAYEIAQSLQGAECAMADSALPETERVIRPLAKLKTDKQRQSAWETANKMKKGEKVTAEDTLAAVKLETLITDVQKKDDMDFKKELKNQNKADNELAQIAEQGISTKEAFEKVHKSWTELIKGEDDDRAVEVLARIFIEYLQSKYN